MNCERFYANMSARFLAYACKNSESLEIRTVRRDFVMCFRTIEKSLLEIVFD
jgi:hypothetical protein